MRGSTTTEDTVQYVADSSGDAAKILENVKVIIESKENGVDTAVMIGSIVLRL